MIREELLDRVNNMAKQTQRSTSEQLEVLVEFAADAWELGGFKEAATGLSLDAKQTLNLIGETARALAEILSLLDQKTLTKIQKHFEEKKRWVFKNKIHSKSYQLARLFVMASRK